ncbi:MAG: DUF2061 domain-containing protein [Nanoarchaeota archaeon]
MAKLSGKFGETVSRSFAKALTWRALTITLDSAIVYILTRRVDLTAAIVILSNVASTVAYFFHERVWNLAGFGRKAKVRIKNK